ncbi:hypothetical protein DAEQUDRAFT_715970 [Daedalea quercina L-15889]|uniref:RING-type domain-containing protein n=1 Tax=Daedalea quercina L-15889 TaxID=1314783 RepID=A0A165MLG3_9APHY|nr:hypothetical protein DAEQUDRAFT_715970 [Daedalea quercina L-15889]
MDNQHSIGGFLQHLLDANPRIGEAIHRYVRGLTNHQEQHREPSLPLDDPDLADMPPLEPVSDDPASRGSSPEHGEQLEDIARSVGDLSLTSPPTPDSAMQNQNRPTSTVPLARTSSQQSRAPSAGSASAPLSLHSGSDVDVDMHDAEMRASQASHTHSPQTGSRRARVDDEIDEEDLRETNRQRMSSPDQSDDIHARQAQPAAPNANPQQHQAPPDEPPPPYPGSRFVFSFDIFPGFGLDAPEQGQQGQQGDAQAQDQGHHHNHHRPPLPGFNFTFHIPASPPAGDGTGVNGAPPMPGFPPQFFPFVPGAEAFFMPFFPFGVPREEEVDDPERAEKLIRGLEEVPAGLIARIERLSSGDGDSLCSVCWEKLSSEGGGFDVEEHAGTGADAGARMDVDDHAASNSGTLPQKPSPAKDLPRVVALPCSHVFHTYCLLPWFTKPHRTTCPSCRFDVDPESLTYSPPRQHRQRVPTSQGPAQAPAGAQPPQTRAAANAHPASGQTQTAPQAVPIPQPTPNAPHAAAPGANADQPPRPGPGQGTPFEFNLFFPIMGGPGGPAATYVPLDPQTTRNLFERLFGGVPQQAPPEPEGQQPRFAPLDNAPAPGAAPNDWHAPAGNNNAWGMPNLWQNMFGVHPPQPPQAAANPAAGAAPQRPASAASTGSRGQGRTRPPEKRQWTPPAPPGPTLRQRVERMEREHGLRCWDMSCGLGPSDEDPFPVIDPSTIRQISINRIGSNGEKVCEHTFHPSCLVSAERVAGWGGEDKKQEKEGEEVEVSCPVCRAVGVMSRADWDEGACALA